MTAITEAAAALSADAGPAPRAGKALLEVDRVSVRFGGVQALNEVSLNIVQLHQPGI
jgi:hypothetical protein